MDVYALVSSRFIGVGECLCSPTITTKGNDAERVELVASCR